ncbi:XdhC family aldehyde oxidoreductase maturation factor [Desulfopila sp. IMCC35008]|uniref:XdhC family aldehyde oxidoreductase maturation factor n=1 Tax=Desulfopila sp. IMCC35008 TaxID=2653858 RepID=UPI0013D58CA3|nr:XdhC/CoxI family protein [Desulfopila sp. IMCC35008]
MRFILDTLTQHLQKNEPVVIGAIIRSSGSVPRSSGARMLVTKDGTLHGTVGGGALEGQCHKVARELFETEKSFRLKEFSMTASDAADVGMVCGGAATVLLQRIEPEQLSMLTKLQEMYLRATRPVLITAIPHGGAVPSMAIFGEEQESSLIPESILATVPEKSRREPYLLNENTHDYFIEPLAHPGVVHLVGAGHVALATARMAAFTGFEVVVMDDREEFANSSRYPEAREVRVLENFDNCITDMGPGDYVVIVTRGHMHDRDVLAQSLQTEAGYIGMIGSSKKRKAVYDSLLQSGFTEADLQRVHSPIGISIGADTPEEIGISIVAELIQVRAGLNT